MIRSEVRVRPVTRYLVTEFSQDGAFRKSHCLGAYPSPEIANRVATALAMSLGNAGHDVTLTALATPEVKHHDPVLPSEMQAVTTLALLGGVPPETLLHLPPELGALTTITVGQLRALLWPVAYPGKAT